MHGTTLNLFGQDGIDVTLTATHIHIKGSRQALEMARPLFGYWRWDEKTDPALPTGRARVFRSWQNMERLGRFFPGQLRHTHPDHPLRVAMQKGYAEYKAQVELGFRAKAGQISFEHPLKFPPWAHQKMLFTFLVVMKHGVLTADCGAGKTYVALSLIDWFKKQRGSVKALVACPISIIDEAWGEDTAKLTDLRWTSLWVPQPYVRKAEREAGMTQATKRRGLQLEQLDRDDVDLWVANFETVRNPDMLKALRRKKFDIVVVDEATKIKNPQSKSFKALREVGKNAEHRVPMTGTLGAKDCLDVWAPFTFADEGETLDANFTDFRADFAQAVRVGDGQFDWRPKKGAEARLAPLISRRSARVRLEDCIELPPATTIVRRVHMTTRQCRAHRTMEEELYAELEGASLSVQNQLAKLAKLRQITGGFVNIDGDWVPLATNPKMDELRLLLSEVGLDRKVIVWSEYKAEIRAIMAAFPERNPVARYGEVSKAKQTANFLQFRDDPSCTMLVSHPLSSAHGLTATCAPYSISYSISYDYDQDYQKNRRIRRPGQSEPCFFIYLVAIDPGAKPQRTVDQKMYDVIRRKGRMSDILTPGRFDRGAYEAALERASSTSAP